MKNAPGRYAPWAEPVPRGVTMQRQFRKANYSVDVLGQHPGDGFATLDAAQVRCADAGDRVPHLAVKARERLVEPLHRPAEPLRKEFDARAPTLHREQFVQELARGVAVVGAETLDLLAEQHAVVRLVAVNTTQRDPGFAAPGGVFKDIEQRVRPRALGLEHPVEEGNLLLVGKRWLWLQHWCQSSLMCSHSSVQATSLRFLLAYFSAVPRSPTSNLPPTAPIARLSGGRRGAKSK